MAHAARGQVNYDFEQQLLQYYQVAMNYNSQCYGLRLEFRDFQARSPGADLNDREIRFSLSLKNVGTFLDLNSRSSTDPTVALRGTPETR